MEFDEGGVAYGGEDVGAARRADWEGGGGAGGMGDEGRFLGSFGSGHDGVRSLVFIASIDFDGKGLGINDSLLSCLR